MLSGSSKLVMSLSPSLPFSLSPFRFSLTRSSSNRHRNSYSYNGSVSLPLLSSSPCCSLSKSSHLLPPPPPPPKSLSLVHRRNSNFASASSSDLSSVDSPSHPWPEWSNLVDNLLSSPYFQLQSSSNDEDAFSVHEDLPHHFIRASHACLAFARNRSDLLGLLSRKDLEVLAANGSAFLFKNGMNSARKLRSFLDSSNDTSTVLESERAQTVDVMRFLLSYAYNALTPFDGLNFNNRELVETSVRNLLSEFVSLSRSFKEPDLPKPAPQQNQNRYGQSPRRFGQSIEMKRGDWICPKCSFMNFAKNLTCLDCNEVRPKRYLTGTEWECPQCDFFNYGRNAVCIRCDCKRPGESPLETASPSSETTFGQILNGANSIKSDVENRFSTKDEKAERLFGEVSQLDASSKSGAVADEDTNEIMPLRKGVNRFVVSTRKTPLERRLENAQSRDNIWESGNPGLGTSDKSSKSSISERLDRILGRTAANPQIDKNASGKAEDKAGGTDQSLTSSQCSQSLGNQKSDSGYVPFMPLHADMFAKPQDTNTGEKVSESSESISTKAGETSSPSVSTDCVAEKLIDNNKGKEQAEKSERWFKKVSELHDVTDLASAISDEDFPEIMPMRKGENRFVVSKKKDRSLTSPQYKRRLAMEQSNSSNFVPFVPFPPDYFAKKDKQPEDVATSEKTLETSAPEKLSHTRNSEASTMETVRSSVSNSKYQQTDEAQKSVGFMATNAIKVDAASSGVEGILTQPDNNMGTNSGDGRKSAGSGKDTSDRNSNQQVHNASNRKLSGKSLEGSLVKELDPLDMSEEAKAERWFRQVAQIKDISELSQIPDEDFPSIMPMRKGVNRFVVSKRKTPMERRLTSPRYRKNLPIVSSDPTEKKDVSG